MVTNLRDALIEDMRRMEDAACDLTLEHRVSLGKVVYWCCVAVLHIITWIIRKEDGHA